MDCSAESIYVYIYMLKMLTSGLWVIFLYVLHFRFFKMSILTIYYGCNEQYFISKRNGKEESCQLEKREISD